MGTLQEKDEPEMSHRQAQLPQEIHTMLKQAERGHESKKLAELVERLKHQLAERERAQGPDVASPKPPMAALTGNGKLSSLPRSSWFQES